MLLRKKLLRMTDWQTEILKPRAFLIITSNTTISHKIPAGILKRFLEWYRPYECSVRYDSKLHLGTPVYSDLHIESVNSGRGKIHKSGNIRETRAWGLK